MNCSRDAQGACILIHIRGPWRDSPRILRHPDQSLERGHPPISNQGLQLLGWGVFSEYPQSLRGSRAESPPPNQTSIQTSKSCVLIKKFSGFPNKITKLLPKVLLWESLGHPNWTNDSPRERPKTHQKTSASKSARKCSQRPQKRVPKLVVFCVFFFPTP